MQFRSWLIAHGLLFADTIGGNSVLRSVDGVLEQRSPADEIEILFGQWFSPHLPGKLPQPLASATRHVNRLAIVAVGGHDCAPA